jgi:hypothetical protein
MSTQAPILFLVFNRYHPTVQVFETIKKERPKKLYIAADGPRDDVDDDLKKCAEVRKIFEMIDWDCEVFTLFQDNNLGPCKSQIAAINWFFEHENEGVILEDDALPDKTFYMFCYLLLDKYRHDHRVSMISGCNFQQQNKRGNADYYFSKHTNTYACAMWKRSWNLMDTNLVDWPDFLNAGGIDDFSNSSGVRRRFKEAFNGIYENPKLTYWDFLFMFSSLKNGALSIAPNVNLVKNIGFGPGATNPVDTDSAQAMLETFNINLPLKHPSIISRNLIADEFESIACHYKRSVIEKIIYYSFAWKKLYSILKTKYFGANK